MVDGGFIVEGFNRRLGDEGVNCCCGVGGG